MTTVLVASASVHTTAAACDHLGPRLSSDDAVIVLGVSEPGLDDRDVGDAGNVARTRLVEPAVETVVEAGDPAEVRDRLLDIRGVGPKTADCVLLFAGGQDGVFPVDTHVHRIARRIGLAPPDADHEAVRAALEASVPGEKCGFGHTAMIQFGREYCTAQRPACLDGPEACPLYDFCDRVGVDEVGESVVDPAETASD